MATSDRTMDMTRGDIADRAGLVARHCATRAGDTRRTSHTHLTIYSMYGSVHTRVVTDGASVSYPVSITSIYSNISIE